MGKPSKTIAAFLTIIIAISFLTLMIVKPANAQSTPKPSPPEYTLTYSPALETIIHTDPYNGTQTAEIVDKSIIEFKIKNQPFVKSFNGVNYYLFYSINAKGHYSTNEYWGADARYFYQFGNFTKGQGLPQNSLEATDSEFTTISIPIGGDFPSNSKIDVYVSAALMFDGELYVYDYIGDLYPRTIQGIVLGEVSAPSIQTLDLADGSVTTFTAPPSTSITSPTNLLTPTSTPISPNTNSDSIILPLPVFTLIIMVIVLLVVALSVLALSMHRKTVDVT